VVVRDFVSAVLEVLKENARKRRETMWGQGVSFSKDDVCDGRGPIFGKKEQKPTRRVNSRQQNEKIPLSGLS